MAVQSRSVAIFPLAFAVIVSLLFISPSAAALSPAGDVQQINAPSKHWQVEPAVAVAAGDGFLVIWEDMRDGIAGRFVDAAGSPQGGEIGFVANTAFPQFGEVPYTANRHATAVSLPDGDFLLLWTRLQGELSFGFFRSDFRVESRAVFAQRFTSAGAAASEPFQVSGPVQNEAQRPSAAVLRDGRIAVVWEEGTATPGGGHVAGRILDLAANAAGQIFQVSDVASDETWRPVVTAAKPGGFLVAWTAEDSDGRGILARLYTASGEARAPVVVNQVEEAAQSEVTVAPAAGGGFLLAWQHALGDGELRTYGRFVSPQGQPLGDERALSVELSEAEAVPTLAALPNGGFRLFWLGWHYDLPQWVVALDLDPRGEVVGDPVQVSDQRPRPQLGFGVAVGHGSTLVVWEGREGTGNGIDGRTLPLPAARETAVLQVSN